MRKLLVVLSVVAAISFAAADQSPEKARKKGHSGPPLKFLKQRLKALDKNKDGAVQKKEFKGPAKVFKFLDKNGDGKISRADLRKAKRKAKGCSKETVREGKKAPKAEAPVKGMGARKGHKAGRGPRRAMAHKKGPHVAPHKAVKKPMVHKKRAMVFHHAREKEPKGGKRQAKRPGKGPKAPKKAMVHKKQQPKASKREGWTRGKAPGARKRPMMHGKTRRTHKKGMKARGPGRAAPGPRRPCAAHPRFYGRDGGRPGFRGYCPRACSPRRWTARPCCPRRWAPPRRRVPAGWCPMCGRGPGTGTMYGRARGRWHPGRGYAHAPKGRRSFRRKAPGPRTSPRWKAPAGRHRAQAKRFPRACPWAPCAPKMKAPGAGKDWEGPRKAGKGKAPKWKKGSRGGAPEARRKEVSERGECRGRPDRRFCGKKHEKGRKRHEKGGKRHEKGGKK